MAAFIPVIDREKFYNRKGKLTQNVLAACTLDGLFTYVLAGAEGSYNESMFLGVWDRLVREASVWLMADTIWLMQGLGAIVRGGRGHWSLVTWPPAALRSGLGGTYLR
ncbi:hypothetical protein E4U16_004566 [Claviceps sp. LM84 group G4]|nr:hypothetical protein E4U33_005926 [Claviceps sp. LM78 group G4]KAG6073642.1 hypothetical protein E4U16_004566 [Claviceps sp. LM84 group G4]